MALSSLLRITRPLRSPRGFVITSWLMRSIATTPVYLEWWLVDGRIASTDNPPPLIEEETFFFVQQVPTEYGRGREAIRLSCRGPQLLSGCSGVGGMKCRGGCAAR